MNDNDETEDDEEDDSDYDDEALQLRPDDLACQINQNPVKQEALKQKYVLVLKHCPLACGKSNRMCIRTCNCPKGFVMNSDGRCKKMPEKIKIEITENSGKSIVNEKESRRDIGK